MGADRDKQLMTIKQSLDTPAIREKLAAIASKTVDPERILKLTLAMIANPKNHKMTECSTVSMVLAMMACAELGLEPNSTLGHAYLVPYAGVLTFIPGYRGLMVLAHRAGVVASISTGVVYEGDQIEVIEGDEPHILHRPNIKGTRDDSKIVLFYVISSLPNGNKQQAWMTKGEVDKIRARSKAKDDGPWVTDYAQMGLKTVIRRAAKLWPMDPSSALAKAIEKDDEATGLILDSELAKPTDAASLMDSMGKSPGRSKATSARPVIDTTSTETANAAPSTPIPAETTANA